MHNRTDLADFPLTALASIANIEAMLAEGFELLDAHASEPAAFALRATRERYLPDTIQAYLAIPARLRKAAEPGEKSADEILISTLATLEDATASHLVTLAKARKDALSVQDHFLKSRFAGLEHPSGGNERNSTPGAQSATLPQVMLRPLFDQLQQAPSHDDQRLIEEFAQALLQRCPSLVKVERDFLRRSIRRLTIDIPIKNALLRYSLDKVDRRLETKVAKLVHDIALKTEVVSTDIWIDALVDHLTTYMCEDRQGKDRLRELTE